MGVFQNMKLGPSAKTKEKPTSDVDLQKLRRVDLLELLLDQIRKNEAQTAELAESNDLNSRLKAKLDEKDALIERLKTKLDQKDAQIGLLQERIQEAAESAGAVNAHDLEIEERAIQRYLQQLALKSIAATAEAEAADGKGEDAPEADGAELADGSVQDTPEAKPESELHAISQAIDSALDAVNNTKETD